MSYWNYRILRTEGEYPRHMQDRESDIPKWDFFSVYEVYYDDNNKPIGCTKNPITICGDTPEDVQESFNRIQTAFDKPILEWNDFQ